MDNKVKKYFEAIPDKRKPHFYKLHKAITDCFPEAVLDMKYKMPTYSFQQGWVAIANQKNYVSLYTCGAIHLVDFKLKHPSYKTGKGCINFSEKDSIPTVDIKAVIKHAILHPKG